MSLANKRPNWLLLLACLARQGIGRGWFQIGAKWFVLELKCQPLVFLACLLQATPASELQCVAGTA
eukprot:2877969-Amphidinium_carterae.1